jgi:tRNA threonylcarbamoyladenosine biosynthesis protein TsaE
MIITTHSTAQTESAGEMIAKTLHRGDFVAMFGDLGVGKTAFVRGMAKYLCPGARVQSPTYTIVNEYRGSIPLYHFDMYRIDGEETLYATGFFDYIENGICVAEWCENIGPYIPDRSVIVKIEKDPSGNDTELRTITIEDRR